MTIADAEIGAKYHYPDSKKEYTLKSSNGFSFRFECGHWCTDNVFIDLLPVIKQLKLNL